MKRTPMKRSAWPFPSSSTQQEKEDAKNQRMRSMVDSVKLAPKRASTMARAATSIKPAPKKPADRNKMYRALAEGEDCTVQLPGGACDPSTVVLAHTNTQADQKGTGYKGHDSAGFFACHRCHSLIDQPPASSGINYAMLVEIVKLAQARTDVRLLAIANSPSTRAWKVRAARWALERRGINCD